MDRSTGQRLTVVIWNLRTIEMGESTIDLTPAGGQVALRFTTEPHPEHPGAMRLDGHTGCNTLDGAYTISGAHTLTVPYLSATEIYCGDHAFEIEQAYLAILGTATTYQTESRQLRLVSDHLDGLLIFEASAAHNGSI